jgi:2,4-dienoyl-CoA reductase (NADPH2)
VGYRIILREWVPQGIDLTEALAFAQVLGKKGVAYLSASAGTYNSMFSPSAVKIMAQTAYLKKDMARLTGTVGIPTIMSGRITTPPMADKLVREGVADLIGLGRSLRTDPRWVAKALAKDRGITACVNCNWCLKRVVLEQGFNCRRWPEIIRERTALAHQLITRHYKALWVISDARDIQTFKASLPLLSLGKKKIFPPSVLILKAALQDRAGDLANEKFIEWITEKFAPMGPDETIHCVVREHKGNREKIVRDEIARFSPLWISV